MFSFITSISGLILSCNETMIFVCTYLQSTQFVSVKDMRNLRQNSEYNDGSGQKYYKTGHACMAVNRKSTNCEAVDWATTAHVQKSRDLKSADINRLVAVMAGELRQQSTRLEFPWKIPNFITSVNEQKIKMAQ